MATVIVIYNLTKSHSFYTIQKPRRDGLMVSMSAPYAAVLTRKAPRMGVNSSSVFAFDNMHNK